MLGGDGPVLEYAVRMHRFATGALFSERLASGGLCAEDIDQLAALLADFHQQAPVASASSGFATGSTRRATALAALDGLGEIAGKNEQRELRDWLDTKAHALMPLWNFRLATSRVRECHGDLHLANLVRLNAGVAAFDGIEFDPALRWIDVIDDVAFVVMDLLVKGRRDFAFRFINAWLDRTGDHAGLPTLAYAMVYRALVRAQVHSLRGAQGMSTARSYIENATAFIQPAQPRLFIMHGLPGSGKTFSSQRLLEREGAIRLRSDVERKRLFGLGMREDSRLKGLDIYGADTTGKVYARLFRIAHLVLMAGFPVILDAAFLRRAERAEALALANTLGVDFSIVVCEAPIEVLRSRLTTRHGDASEADVTVLDKLQGSAEPLSGLESTYAFELEDENPARNAA